MAYNSTNNLPGMSYEEYKRAMEKKRAKEGKRNDDLPEAFLKLFEKHNVAVPEAVKRPVPAEEEIEEVYEEEEIPAEEIEEAAEEEVSPAPGMSRRERRLAREEQVEEEIAEEEEIVDDELYEDEEIIDEEADDEDEDVPLAGLTFLGKKLSGLIANRKNKNQEDALTEEDAEETEYAEDEAEYEEEIADGEEA